MMLESTLRPFFQRTCINPVANIAANFTHPNAITLFSFITGLIAAIFLSLEHNFLAVIFLLLSGYLDILDGSVARLNNQSSQMGTIFDILSDRMVESFIVIALVVREPELAFIALLMMMSMLVCVSSFLLVGIFSEAQQKSSQKSFYYSPGLMERAEAFIFFILMILFPLLSFTLGVIFTVLVLWTTLYRVYEFSGYVKEMEITNKDVQS